MYFGKESFLHLCLNNLYLTNFSSGYHMSGLLYLWGMTDPRVRPLVFTIRKWAKYHDLVGQQRPTTLFTNFPLTLMVIFFLQNKHQILPSVLTLHSLASKYLIALFVSFQNSN